MIISLKNADSFWQCANLRAGLNTIINRSSSDGPLTTEELKHIFLTCKNAKEAGTAVMRTPYQILTSLFTEVIPEPEVLESIINILYEPEVETHMKTTCKAKASMSHSLCILHAAYDSRLFCDLDTTEHNTQKIIENLITSGKLTIGETNIDPINELKEYRALQARGTRICSDHNYKSLLQEIMQASHNTGILDVEVVIRTLSELQEISAHPDHHEFIKTHTDSYLIALNNMCNSDSTIDETIVTPLANNLYAFNFDLFNYIKEINNAFYRQLSEKALEQQYEYLLANKASENPEFETIQSHFLQFCREVLGGGEEFGLIIDLFSAAKYHILKYLLDHDLININVQAKEGEFKQYCVLGYFAALGECEKIEWLLKNYREKIDLEVTEKAGATPLMLAITKGSEDVFSLLVGHGAKIDAVDLSQNNLLHLAVLGGHEHIIDKLIDEYGFKPEDRVCTVQNSVDIALYMGHFNIVKKFIGKGVSYTNNIFRETAPYIEWKHCSEDTAKKILAFVLTTQIKFLELGLNHKEKDFFSVLVSDDTLKDFLIDLSTQEDEKFFKIIFAKAQSYIEAIVEMTKDPMEDVSWSDIFIRIQDPIELFRQVESLFQKQTRLRLCEEEMQEEVQESYEAPTSHEAEEKEVDGSDSEDNESAGPCHELGGVMSAGSCLWDVE